MRTSTMSSRRQRERAGPSSDLRVWTTGLDRPNGSGTPTAPHSRPGGPEVRRSARGCEGREGLCTLPKSAGGMERSPQPDHSRRQPGQDAPAVHLQIRTTTGEQRPALPLQRRRHHESQPSIVAQEASGPLVTSAAKGKGAGITLGSCSQSGGGFRRFCCLVLGC